MIKLEARYRPLVQYGFAVVSVGIVLLILLIAPLTLVPNAYVLFFLAVIVSSWYGNFITGTTTSILSLLAMKHYGFYTTTTTDYARTDMVRFLIFGFVVIVISLIQWRHHRIVNALRRSRDQLEIYMRDMANGVLVQDRDGKLIYANYEAARLMDFVSVEAMLAATRDQLLDNFDMFDELGEPFPPSSLPGRLALLGMRYPETVLRYRYKDSKRERWAYDKARPVFDANGQVQYSISLFLDITELKQAQQALADQREQFRVTLHSITDAVIASDSEGKITFVNPVASALTGWSEEAALGRPLALAFRIRDEQTLSELPSPVDSVLQQGSPVKLLDNVLLIPKDGTQRSIAASSAPILDAQGHTMGAVLVFWDMSERKSAEIALHARVRQQEAVARLGQRALEGIDLDTLMQEAADSLAQTLQIEYTTVLELLPDGKQMLLRAGYGWEDGLVGKATVDTGSHSQAGYTMIANEPVIVVDLPTETRFNGPPLLREHNVVSGMSAIIAGDNGPWGVIGAHTTASRVFTQEDVNFLRAVANLLASSISRARVAEAEREQRVFAEALRDTAEALNGTLDLGQVLDRVLENVERVVPHDAADIMLIEGDNARVVRYRGYSELMTVAALKDMRLSLTGAATLRMMVQTRAPLLIDDTHQWPGWLKIPHMEWLRSYVAVPLVAQGSVKGFLNLTSIQPDFFTEQQAKRLQTFAAQVTAAIQNAELYGEALRRADENRLREVAQELRRRI